MSVTKIVSRDKNRETSRSVEASHYLTEIVGSGGEEETDRERKGGS